MQQHVADPTGDAGFPLPRNLLRRPECKRTGVGRCGAHAVKDSRVMGRPMGWCRRLSGASPISAPSINKRETVGLAVCLHVASHACHASLVVWPEISDTGHPALG